MSRSFAVFGLAFAGVLLLAGPGWALLAGAGLALVLWRREPDWHAVQALLAGWARGAVARVRERPRRVTAVGGMTGGILLVPAGLSVAAGWGVAVAAAGALLIGLSLLTGQGA